MKKLVLDDEYLEQAVKLLSSAKSSVDIICYSFAIGSANGKLNQNSAPFTLAQTLIQLKKKNKKLRIRIYTEGVRETVERNKVTMDYLKKEGIEIVYGATHAKGFCVDQKKVLFGSTNWTHQSMTKNGEANLYLTDKKTSTEFMRYFEHLWKGGGHGEISLAAPMLADGEFKDELVGLIEKSKKTIHFSIYFFHHKEIEEALKEAHTRGVKISGFIHQHASFALSYIRRNLKVFKRLKAAGIRDLWMGPPQTFSHSKYIVFDQKTLMLGTGNWLEEDVLIHPQLYIKLQDSVLAKGLINHLKGQIKKKSHPALNYV